MLDQLAGRQAGQFPLQQFDRPVAIVLSAQHAEEARRSEEGDPVQPARAALLIQPCRNLAGEAPGLFFAGVRLAHEVLRPGRGAASPEQSGAPVLVLILVAILESSLFFQAPAPARL